MVLKLTMMLFDRDTFIIWRCIVEGGSTTESVQ